MPWGGGWRARGRGFFRNGGRRRRILGGFSAVRMGGHGSGVRGGSRELCRHRAIRVHVPGCAVGLLGERFSTNTAPIGCFVRRRGFQATRMERFEQPACRKSRWERASRAWSRSWGLVEVFRGWRGSSGKSCRCRMTDRPKSKTSWWELMEWWWVGVQGSFQARRHKR